MRMALSCRLSKSGSMHWEIRRVEEEVDDFIIEEMMILKVDYKAEQFIKGESAKVSTCYVALPILGSQNLFFVHARFLERLKKSAVVFSEVSLPE